jgi:hypothetical protein
MCALQPTQVIVAEASNRRTQASATLILMD